MRWAAIRIQSVLRIASIGVITALLAENFASAKRADENSNLPKWWQ